MNSPIEENVKYYPNSMETRISMVELAIVGINQTLSRIESKIDAGITENRLELKDFRKETKSDFKWILAVITGLGAIMAHGFHWF